MTEPQAEPGYTRSQPTRQAVLCLNFRCARASPTLGPARNSKMLSHIIWNNKKHWDDARLVGPSCHEFKVYELTVIVFLGKVLLPQGQHAAAAFRRHSHSVWHSRLPCRCCRVLAALVPICSHFSTARGPARLDALPQRLPLLLPMALPLSLPMLVCGGSGPDPIATRADIV